MGTSDKPSWNTLGILGQMPWLQKAAYLLERKYPTEKDLYKLAEKLYNSST